MKSYLKKLSIVCISFPALGSLSFAASTIDLSHQAISLLTNPSLTASAIDFTETKRLLDSAHTLHVRVQETFRGYPVYGADAVIHIPKMNMTDTPFKNLINSQSKVNGKIYQTLEQDLINTPSHIFDTNNLEKASDFILAQYQKNRHVSIQDKAAKLIVYIDSHNKAHWAYQISFFTPGSETMLAESPVYIVDAITFDIYKKWNDLKSLEAVLAGGDGGNHKTRQKIFDGATDHLPALSVMRDTKKKICSAKNDNVTIKDFKTNKMITFICSLPDKEHNNVYWNRDVDKFETTWSPLNDVLFGSKVAYDLYQNWYQIPVLNKLGTPMHLTITIHDPSENAYWHKNQVTFGNSIGSEKFNPLTSLDTVVHEISHGFTEQNSGLTGNEQAAAVNEAFSDMAGATAEEYAYGKTDYLVRFGDIKAEDKALRYMDQPSKDCGANDVRGESCSIDTLDEYKSGMDAHFTAGLFNHAFYMLARTNGWGVKKAFEVMIKANMHYWTSNVTFADAACGVLWAARESKYDITDVAAAFKTVGIETKSCGKFN